MTHKEPQAEVDLCRMGVPGLDHVLQGGLPRARLYLVEGDPGAGKTTLALQFLMEASASKRPCCT